MAWLVTRTSCLYCQWYTMERCIPCPSRFVSLDGPYIHGLRLSRNHHRLREQRNLQMIRSNAVKCKLGFLCQARSDSFAAVSFISLIYQFWLLAVASQGYPGTQLLHRHVLDWTVGLYVAALISPWLDQGRYLLLKLGRYPWVGTRDQHPRIACNWQT